jgi:hypothetical protein
MARIRGQEHTWNQELIWAALANSVHNEKDTVLNGIAVYFVIGVEVYRGNSNTSPEFELEVSKVEIIDLFSSYIP